jgi:arylsulfatase A-like enzyme
LFWRFGKQIAVRKGDWKLVKAPGAGATFDEAADGATTDDAQLFNLAHDIGEQTNLAAQEPDKVKELAAEWQKWNAELVAATWHPVRNAADRAQIKALIDALAEPKPATGDKPSR